MILNKPYKIKKHYKVSVYNKGVFVELMRKIRESTEKKGKKN
jgi:hypothetical protein